MLVAHLVAGAAGAAAAPGPSTPLPTPVVGARFVHERPMYDAAKVSFTDLAKVGPTASLPAPL
jgi:hypothetical protein